MLDVLDEIRVGLVGCGLAIGVEDAVVVNPMGVGEGWCHGLLKVFANQALLLVSLDIMGPVHSVMVPTRATTWPEQRIFLESTSGRNHGECPQDEALLGVREWWCIHSL